MLTFVSSLLLVSVIVHVIEARRHNLFQSLHKPFTNDKNDGVFHVSLGADWSPSTRLVEMESETIIVIEIPGVAREDISITLQDGILTVTGATRFCPSQQEGSPTGLSDKIEIIEEEDEDGDKDDAGTESETPKRPCPFKEFEKKFESKFSLKWANIGKIWAEIKLSILYLHVPRDSDPQIREIPIITEHDSFAKTKVDNKKERTDLDPKINRSSSGRKLFNHRQNVNMKGNDKQTEDMIQSGLIP